MEQRTCAQGDCANKFEVTDRGKVRKYCSKRCRDTQNRRDARERGDAWATGGHTIPIVCHHCDTTFMGKRTTLNADHQRRYCSMACQSEARSWRTRTILDCDVPWASCQSCSAHFIQRNNGTDCPSCNERKTLRKWVAGSCRECGDTFVGRWHPMWPSQFCSDACHKKSAKRRYRQKHGRAEEHRKRARRYGGRYEPVSRLRVFKRDGYICQICGEPTSAKYTFDDPLSPTLDHIHPMSKGGDHTYLNVQCAHAACNSMKSDSVGEDAPQLNLAL